MKNGLAIIIPLLFASSLCFAERNITVPPIFIKTISGGVVKSTTNQDQICVTASEPTGFTPGGVTLIHQQARFDLTNLSSVPQTVTFSILAGSLLNASYSSQDVLIPDVVGPYYVLPSTLTTPTLTVPANANSTYIIHVGCSDAGCGWMDTLNTVYPFAFTPLLNAAVLAGNTQVAGTYGGSPGQHACLLMQARINMKINVIGLAGALVATETSFNHRAFGWWDHVFSLPNVVINSGRPF